MEGKRRDVIVWKESRLTLKKKQVTVFLWFFLLLGLFCLLAPLDTAWDSLGRCLNKNLFNEIYFVSVLNNLFFKKTQWNSSEGKFKHVCVWCKSYTATDALLSIRPSCRPTLSPICVFVARDTIRRVCSWTDLFEMNGVRDPWFYCTSLQRLLTITKLNGDLATNVKSWMEKNWFGFIFSKW